MTPIVGGVSFVNDGRKFHGVGRDLLASDGKWGCVDRRGPVGRRLRVRAGLSLFDRFAFVRKDGKWGVLDRRGRLIVPLPLRCGVLSSGNLCARHALRYAGHSADGRCESRCARRVRRGAHLHDRGRVCGGVRHEGPEDRKIAVMPDGSFASTSFCDGAVDACGTAGENHSPKIRLRAAANRYDALRELLLGQRCGFLP